MKVIKLKATLAVAASINNIEVLHDIVPHECIEQLFADRLQKGDKDVNPV